MLMSLIWGQKGKVLEEFEGWLGEPLTRGKYCALEKANVTSCRGHSQQNIVIRVIKRYHIRAVDRIIQSAEKECRDLDVAETGRHCWSLIVVMDTRESSDSSHQLREIFWERQRPLYFFECPLSLHLTLGMSKLCDSMLIILFHAIPAANPTKIGETVIVSSKEVPLQVIDSLEGVEMTGNRDGRPQRRLVLDFTEIVSKDTSSKGHSDSIQFPRSCFSIRRDAMSLMNVVESLFEILSISCMVDSRSLIQ